MRFPGLRLALRLVVAGWAAAGAAMAADRALVIGNASYADGFDVAGAADAGRAALALRAAGFTVTRADDLPGPALRQVMSGFLQSVNTGDRVVILLAGRFAQVAAPAGSPGAAQGWFIATDAATPDLAQIDAQGVSLPVVMQIAAGAGGNAVLLLGREASRADYGRGLRAGVAALIPPAGVAVIQGDAAAVARFAQTELTRRDISLRQMLAAAPGLQPAGLPANDRAFRGPLGGNPVPNPTTPPTVEEERVWVLARSAATVAGYDTYLRRYPAGRYAALARSELARLQGNAGDPAELAEAALALGRDQRRDVQAQLKLLGFDPRGVDGLFGAGSRAAIAAWQRSTGLPANGFLTRDQLTRLAAQADRRAAEQAAAAAARRAEEERQDRIYWDQTGAFGDEAGLRAYKQRYPRGLFAAVAQDRLAIFDARIRERAEAEDRAAWDATAAADSAEAYDSYLRRYPKGLFAAEARNRLQHAANGGLSRADLERARVAEGALALGGLPLVLIERRLQALGFPPGAVDGRIDDETRRAIRGFQAARGLPQTGYLDQQIMVALLAG